ncbi:MAG: DUF11 domain-containing protein, partial [Anaerolineae bacterium]|nr:DUF11 domain-containing protein [Anaerolineae bacterium]
MRTKKALSVLLLLLICFVAVGAVAALKANPEEARFEPLQQEASSTPRPRPTDPLPPTNPPGGSEPTPLPDTAVPIVQPTRVPTLPPTSGCSAAPGQPGFSVRIRENPGVQSDIIQEVMDYRWYPADVSRRPQQADDGNSDDSDGNLWYPVLMPNGDTGWVAGWAVLSSQPDCFGKNNPLASCPADIQALAPDQLPSHDIYFFGDDCRLIDEMVYEDNRTDDLQRDIISLEDLRSCPSSAMEMVYTAARDEVSGQEIPLGFRPVGVDACPIVQEITAQNARLIITKRANVSSISVDGGEVSYTITVENTGGEDAVNVFVTDSFPAGAIFVTCSLECDDNSEMANAIWQLGTLKKGQSVSLSLVLQLPAVDPRKVASQLVTSHSNEVS